MGLDEVREAVFLMPEKFTISDVVNKIKLSHPDEEEIDSMLIRAYLDQIGTAGMVEEVRGNNGAYTRNMPDFSAYTSLHQ